VNPIKAIQDWLAKATPEKKRKALLIVIGGTATLALFMLTGGDPSADSAGSDALYYVGVFFKLAAVLLLIVGGAVIFKRWNGRKSLHKGPGRQMRLVETVRLSPRQALHVVEVAGQHFLIGATDQSISILSPVSLEQAPEAADEASDPGLSFGSVFSNLVQASLVKGGPARNGGSK